jgi:hypothetical protein
MAMSDTKRPKILTGKDIKKIIQAPAKPVKKVKTRVVQPTATQNKILERRESPVVTLEELRAVVASIRGLFTIGETSRYRHPSIHIRCGLTPWVDVEVCRGAVTRNTPSPVFLRQRRVSVDIGRWLLAVAKAHKVPHGSIYVQFDPTAGADTKPATQAAAVEKVVDESADD